METGSGVEMLVYSGVLAAAAVSAFVAGRFLSMREAWADRQALRDDQNRLRLAQQLARIGSWDLDIARNRLVWSDEIFRIFEIDPTGFEASYEAFLSAVHPEDRDAVNEAYQASVRDRVPYSIAHRLLMPDGRIKHVQEVGQTYYDSNGRALRSLGTVQDITERKLSENEHRRALELLRGVLNATRDIIFVKDVNLNYLACNHALTELIGRPEEEIVGHNDADWFSDPTILNAFRDWDRRVLAEGRQQYIEEWVTYPDGRRVPFETLKTPFHDSEGKLLGLIGVSRDITARKEAEAARLESQHRLQAAVDVSQIGIFDHDHARGAIYWSPELRSQFGWGATEVIGLEEFAAAVHPDDRPMVGAAIARSHDPSGDGLYRATYRIVRPDGECRWMEARGRTSFEGEGEARHPVRTIGALLDTTRRKETEEEQQKLASIIEASGDFIAYASLEGQLSYVNAAGLRLVGLDRRDEAMGRQISEFLMDQEAAVLETEVLPSLGRTGTWRGEFALRHFKGNAPIPVEMNAFMIRDQATQEPIALANISRDITQRRRAEAERENLISETEARNAELERFTYTVSHDLKSPLITIKGFLGYLEKSAVEGNVEAVRADIKRITAATDKMDRLLRELLDLSRIGRVANPPKPVPFEEVVREAIELTAGRLGTRGVDIRIAPGLPNVYGDRVRLVEAVQNILDNAAKFMGDQERPLIEIGSRGPNHRGLPVLFIKDNGIGIDSAYHEKVFGLFDKLDKRSEGTGIGLAVVKRIIETHGGGIWIESLGEGSGVSVCFALPSPPEGAEEKAPPVL